LQIRILTLDSGLLQNDDFFQEQAESYNRRVTLEKSYDILIVGGGIIGSSLAMALVELGRGEIGVVDVDLSGKWSSSERNAGGVRAFWEQPVNINLSRLSISFFEKIAAKVGFHQNGYLWLHDEAGWKAMDARITPLRENGCEVKRFSPKEIQQHFSFLDRLDGVAGGTFSPRDGLINPNLLKGYYRDQALSGVDWIDRHRVDGIIVEGEQVKQVRLREVPAENDIGSFLKEGAPSAGGRVSKVTVQTLVNTCGAWAPSLAKLYGENLPSNPVRRQVSVVHCQEVDLSSAGMIVDTSGLYFHSEAGNILAGYSIPSEPSGVRFDDGGSNFFLQEIWPRLSARSSQFERLKRVGGWAGLYAVSPDKSAIIGPVEGFTNLFEAHSFSGRGIMQSYAVGQALAERIHQGEYKTIDLSSLSGNRFRERKWIPEGMHI
jgi:glycine/D-amino acid oxidase-like deaminating enzyme